MFVSQLLQPLPPSRRSCRCYYRHRIASHRGYCYFCHHRIAVVAVAIIVTSQPLLLYLGA